MNQIRRIKPFTGGVKLWRELNTKGFHIGRDRLFDLLRRHRLILKPKKRGPRTTYSKHWMHKYSNLIKDRSITGPNQVFVSDITYLRVRSGFVYLSLVTDAFSRKIVGWNVSSSLGVQGALSALRMALKSCPDTGGLIHHSDRGIQYCCTDYVKELVEHNALISMTEENHCYENAIAERVNGILKQEFSLGDTLPSLKVARELVRESIEIYNFDRLHTNLDYQTPGSVHGKKTA